MSLSIVPRHRFAMAILLFLAFFTLNAPLVTAQGSVSESLAIPEQALSRALVKLGAAFDATIVAPDALTKGLTSTTVIGELSVEQALRQMLAGTGLVAKKERASVYVIVEEESHSAIAPPRIIESVVVKGERIERSVQETASSVFAAGEDFLSTTAFTSEVNDLLAFVPNVLAAAGQETPTIRGQNSAGVLAGSGAVLSGTRARATYVIDGRAINLFELTYSASSIWDAGSVEVYRGPQTTTQGQNAIGGAVFINTNSPDYELGGRIRVQGGNFDYQQASGMLNVPLFDDQLAVRVAADYFDRGTFADFVPQTVDDNDLGQSEALNIRAKMLIEPDAIQGFRSLLTYNRLDTNAPQAVNTLDDFKTNTNPNFAHWENVADIGIADLAYDINDSFNLSTVITYTSTELLRLVDPGTGGIELDSTDVTAEVLLTYMGEGKLSGVAGVFYSEREEEGATDVGFDIDGDNDSKAIFGEFTYQMTDRLALTGGLRYQEDTQQRVVTGFGATVLDLDVDYDELLPKAVVTYDLWDDISVGLSASRGYTPGGGTLNFELFVPDFFEEETLWNYEVFYRSIIADGKGVLNANIFYTDFEDTQRGITFAVAGTPLITTFIANAESATAYGAEFEFQWTPNEDWNFLVAMGYIKTELEEFSELANTDFFVGDPIGNSFERTPEFSVSIAATWTPSTDLRFDLRGRYTSEYFSDDLNLSEREVDSLFVLDSRASYTYRDLEVFAFVSNLLDEEQFIVNFGPAFGDVDSDSGLPLQPRTYGFGVDYRF
ncbi:MAG: TonB-dependent receptor [Pseudomonadota bacterium]